MVRKVDTEGEVTDSGAKPSDVGGTTAPIRIEIPLWKLGRILFESRSDKASLAIMAMLLMTLLMPVLALAAIFASDNSGVSTLLDKLGQAWLLILGVLLGAAGQRDADR